MKCCLQSWRNRFFSPISEIINKIETVNNFKVDFDPTHSDQLFTLAMADVSHLVLLPKLTKFLKKICTFGAD